MPTIEQLAPATAASDDDELMVSQSGIVRKVTRAQMLAGVQPQLAVSSGNLLGRNSAGTGAPESITVGNNLVLSAGTLAATDVSFEIQSLPPGTVPASTDLVPLGQGDQDVAVTYEQFMSGLPEVANVDGSQLLVTPTGGTAATKLADWTANVLSLAGGTMIGMLRLAANPSLTMQAATKGYVDIQTALALPKTGGTLSGALIMAADPTASLQAATKHYVDRQVATALPTSGGSLTGALTLSADPAASLQAATKQYVDNRVLRTGDTLTGPLRLAANPTLTMQAATKGYVDIQAALALPLTGGSLTGALTLAADPTVASQAATKRYVDARVLRAGDTLTGPLTLAADPTTTMQAATKNYVDTQLGLALPKCGGALTGALMLPANPTAQMQAVTKQYVDTQVATTIPVCGGTLTGPLMLAADPTTTLQAATKNYVDTSVAASGVINVKSAPYNARINGTTDDTAAFKAAYQAAPAGSVIYVPNGVTVLQNPNSWGIALTKRVKWIVDGTTLPNGTSLADGVPGGTGPASNFLPGVVVGNSGISAEVSQTGSQASDFAVSHSSYIVNHNGGPTGGAVSANSRTDTIIYNSPNNFIWGGLDRLLWCGVQTGGGAATANHVGRYVQTIRQNVGTDSSGKPLPQPQLWAACLEYRDTTEHPSSWTNYSLTIEMDWFGNGPDDAHSRLIQSLVVGQHDTSGAPVEVSSAIGVYLAAGSAGHVYSVFSVNVPFSVAALDTTGGQQLSGAAAIRMAAGHAIAFEATNCNNLAYDSRTNTLRWNQGSLSYPVGKGITVGWLNVYGGSATLPNYISGNMVFLIGGGGSYTITLPPANTVAAGTGFTFSVLGSAPVMIAPSGSDGIDCGPVTLYQNDRYHIVSDAGGTWREIFRTNAVSPHFVAPPVLPSYAVASLPGSTSAGAVAFVGNGRKPGEGAGGGTGVQAYYDGGRWISVCSGSQVQA
jgi:hypothetical protein